MASRHRSVPSSEPSAGGFPNLLTHVSSLGQTSAGGANLLSQADALAKMTVELNLRNVSLQADRLEEDLKALVHATGQDKEFRAQHERRMNDIWYEILAVKTQMSAVDGGQETLKMVKTDLQKYQRDTEKCQQETARMIEGFKQEIDDFKDFCQNIATQLNRLPAAASMTQDVEQGPSEDTEARNDATEGQSRSASQTAYMTPGPSQDLAAQNDTTERHSISSQTAQQEQSPPRRNLRSTTQQAVKKRIQDTLSSTRRWNHDHKTTIFKDGPFITNYLKQQSKRDPAMAVFIQKALQKRVRSHRSRSKNRPDSLEEFCRDIKWSDVLATIEEELIKAEAGAIKALR